MYTTIDTLQITKRLQSKGIKTEAAEEFAEIIKEREQNSFENLVTKDDLLATKTDLENKIFDVRKDLKNEISPVRKEINLAMYKSIIAMGAIVVLIEKFVN